MVKECPVIINNDVVTVIRFDDKDVQIPSVHQEGVKKLNVKFENGIYSVVENIEPQVKNKTIDVFGEPVEVSDEQKNKKKTIKKKQEELID